MTRRTMPSLLVAPLILLMLLSSCGLFDTDISTEPLANSWKWVQVRHDAYVKADESVEADKRAAFLVESAIVSAKLNEVDTIDASEIKTPILSVCARHDGYVESDKNLSPVQRRSFLRSTTLIRKVIEEGGQ